MEHGTAVEREVEGVASGLQFMWVQIASERRAHAVLLCAMTIGLGVAARLAFDRTSYLHEAHMSFGKSLRGIGIGLFATGSTIVTESRSRNWKGGTVIDPAGLFLENFSSLTNELSGARQVENP